MTALAPNPRLWRIALRAPYARMLEYENLFADAALATSCVEAEANAHPMEPAPFWIVEALIEGEPDADRWRATIAAFAADHGDPVPAIVIEPLPDQDWVSATNQLLEPIQAGRLTLYGGHDRHRAPPGWRGLRMDAGQAFGTGRAPSTLGCLMALDHLTRPSRRAGAIRRALDVGTGSGVLAMALKKLHPAARVAVTDIDPVAIAVTRANLRLNGLNGVRAWALGGAHHRILREDGPYDLVMANILSKPLQAMARDLARLVAPRGRLLLSGLLTREEPQLYARFAALGFKKERRFRIEGWSSLVLHRR